MDKIKALIDNNTISLEDVKDYLLSINMIPVSKILLAEYEEFYYKYQQLCK